MKIHFQCPSGHPLSVDPKTAGRRVRCAQCGRSVEVPELLPPVNPDDRPEPVAEPSPWADAVPVLSPVSGDSETVSEPLSERPKSDVPVLPPVASAGKDETPPAAGAKAKAPSAVEDGAASQSVGAEKPSDAKPAHQPAPTRPRPGAPPVRKHQAVARPVSQGPNKNEQGTKSKPAAGTPATASGEKPAPAAADKGTAAEAPGLSGRPVNTPAPAPRAARVDKNRAPADASGAVVGEAIPVEPSAPPTSRLGLLRRSRRPRREETAEGNGQQPDEPADRVGERRAQGPRGPRLVPANVYRPDADHVRTVKWLAVFLGLTVLFSLAPVVRFLHLNPETAPGWARFVLLAAAVEAVFILWMLAAPDWASVWVVMLVFAVVAALYGMGTAIAAATPPHQPLPLGLAEVRTTAASWCGAVMLVMALATYVCGRISAQWRRVYELTHGRRTRPSTR